ncbi:MAG: ATPase, T2SS/T4P/T4SS family [Patescibacteria group bacterium]|nr:ATPase, T2SS/T4P/T4SS family [Patescibacteria group bacterium]
MFIDKNKVEDLILELGLVNQDDFDLAVKEAEEKKLRSCDILIRKGILNEQDLQSLQSKVSGIPFVDLSKQKIDWAILSTIPEPITRRHNIIAFDRDEKSLKVAVLDLDSLEKVDFLKKMVGLKVVPYLTNKDSLNKAISQYQGMLKNEYGAMIQKGSLSFQTIPNGTLKKLPRESILELARSKQVNSVFELLLKHALIQNVSSIHIEPQEDNVLIRYRINGSLYSAMVLPKRSATFLALKIKTLANLRLDTDNLCQNGRFQVGFDGREIDLKIHVIPSSWGEKSVLNILRKGDSGFSLEAAGFHGEGLDLLYKVLGRKKGMILIAGGKQSGKTTTFYTILDILKDPSLSIGTVEDSIGFQMSGISQVVINSEIGFGVSEGINNLAKQDCDVVAVDGLKDLNSNKSISSLLKLSSIVNEDRLALSVVEMKARSSSDVVYKMTSSSKIDSTLIINGLEIVILQKMIPRLPEEKKEYYLSVSEIKSISRYVDLNKVMVALVNENILLSEQPWSEVKFFKSKGKSTEKIMINEISRVSPATRELLREKVPLDKIEKQVKEEGTLTLREEAFFKAVQGLVSIDDVLGNK